MKTQLKPDELSALLRERMAAEDQAIDITEFDGHVVDYELQNGQSIVVDTGHLAAMTASCLIDILQPSAKTVDALMKLDLPAGVDIEIKL